MSTLGYAALFGLLGLVLGVGAGALGWLLWRQHRQVAQIRRDLERLDGSVGVLVDGASGVDRRLGRLEQRLMELQRRIEDLEESRNTTRSYDEAIRLVRQGANAQRLTEELGLSRSEADLLIMLHGGKAPEADGRRPAPASVTGDRGD